ncbi:MAG TPA: Rne/Rng family ribonuclease [Gaiellales bacterium]|jgi:ribonuclease G|nr:Rne/Rng family ribonuclease [Gaiellales bacterium]
MTHVKRMLISADPQEVRVAIVEGGKLSEAYIERRGRRSIVGNIYKGRVDAVLPGMEAAFVDIGLPKNGFLYVAEIVLPELDDRERRSKRIQELIQSGQDVLVQVTKDPMGSKGARLTMDVSLAGRFMVLAPGGDGVGVSKKLEGGERDRLRDLLRKMKTHEDAGLIARTAAQGASLDELERDVRLLEKLWSVSRGHAQRAEAPALVYSEPDLSLQMVRDDFRADVAELVIDDERQYHRILAYVRRTSPELAERVKLYKGKRPLFQRYEIEQGIRSTLSRRVPLPSGGSLVFDYGEAFTVVDVNTGRFTGTTKKLEDTILKNNLEAAVEVVRQLRLRDIGGIIVVDFIDMASQKNRDAVLEVLQRELKKDRSKVYVVEISPLGLVEMTRKNVADGVREIMTCECPVCEGTGRVLSDESLAIDMLRNLRRVARESKSEAFRVELEDGVARALIGAGGSGLDELEHETGRAFDVVGRLDVPREHFAILAEGTLDEIGAQAPPCSPGDELKLPILEPHRFAEADAVSRLSAGYEVQVIGGLPYVGTTQRLRIERATRFAAQAALLDVEPARPVAPSAPRPVTADSDGEVVDKVSDILEPERRVGERLDVEGRVRRQKRRTSAEQRRERGKGGGASGSGGGGGRGPKTPAAEADGEAVVDGDAPETHGTEDSEAAAKRRRRRGGRGRRGRGGSGGGGNGARTPGENGAGEVAANGAPAEPVTAAAGVSERPPREPGAARPRQQQRRRRSSGSGGANGATGEAPADREPAPAATPAPEPPAPAAKSAPTKRDEAVVSEDERRKGLISRILKR